TVERCKLGVAVPGRVGREEGTVIVTHVHDLGGEHLGRRTEVLLDLVREAKVGGHVLSRFRWVWVRTGWHRLGRCQLRPTLSCEGCGRTRSRTRWRYRTLWLVPVKRTCHPTRTATVPCPRTPIGSRCGVWRTGDQSRSAAPRTVRCREG